MLPARAGGFLPGGGLRAHPPGCRPWLEPWPNSPAIWSRESGPVPEGVFCLPFGSEGSRFAGPLQVPGSTEPLLLEAGLGSRSCGTGPVRGTGWNDRGWLVLSLFEGLEVLSRTFCTTCCPHPHFPCFSLGQTPPPPPPRHPWLGSGRRPPSQPSRTSPSQTSRWEAPARFCE